MCKQQDAFEAHYLASLGLNPKATFYLKSLRNRSGYRNNKIQVEFTKFIKKFSC